MKKFSLLCFLILLSCQKDDIFVDNTLPVPSLIFENESIVLDGQDIFFETLTQDTYQLTLLLNNSTVAKETFISDLGLNQRKIFTKSLDKGTYKLVLLKGSEEINSTFIIVE